MHILSVVGSWGVGAWSIEIAFKAVVAHVVSAFGVVGDVVVEVVVSVDV